MNEYEPLIEDYLNGDLAEADASRLHDWLLQDERHMQLFVRMSHQHGVLRDVLSGAGELEQLTDRHAARPASPCDAKDKTALLKAYCFFAQPKPFSMTVAALVIGLLIAAMAFMAPPFYRAITQRRGDAQSDPYHIVAKVTGLHEVEWTDPDNSAHRGAFLVPGRQLQLENGVIEITYRDGVTVLIEGPANFMVQSSTMGKLQVGKVYARVPPEAVGFTIDTPSSRITDLGTEFGIHANDEGEAHVSVVVGQVKVASSDGVQFVSAGEQVRIKRSGEIEMALLSDITFVNKMPIVSSTVLSFRMTDPPPKNSSPIDQSYGDKVSRSVIPSSLHTHHYRGSGNMTPHVEVDYTAGNGGEYLFYQDARDWVEGAGYLRSDNVATKPFYDTVFTPEPGVGVRVKGFMLDDWHGDGQGHTARWGLYAGAVQPENLIVGGAQVIVASDRELYVRTQMKSFHHGPVVLRIEHTNGRGDHLAIDSIHFEQEATGESSEQLEQ